MQGRPLVLDVIPHPHASTQPPTRPQPEAPSRAEVIDLDSDGEDIYFSEEGEEDDANDVSGILLQ